MKKIFSTLTVLVALLAVTVSAAEFKTYSFLNSEVSSVLVSNKFFGVTNILDNVQGTNAAPLRYTNVNSGLIVVGTTLTNDTFNILRGNGSAEGVPLPLVADPYLSLVVVNSTNASSTNAYTFTLPWKLNIKLTGVASGSSSSVLHFRFAPVPDGLNRSTTDVWDCLVVADGTSTRVWTTNFPPAFAGCSKVRLIDVYNADTTANSAVWVQSVKLTAPYSY